MNRYMQAYPVSSLEKVFPDERPPFLTGDHPIAGFRNEQLSFQVAMYYENPRRKAVTVEIDSPIASYIRWREVMLMPSDLPAYPDHDNHYLRAQPGLFPDLLRDKPDGTFVLPPYQWRALWVDVQPCEQVAAGEYPVRVLLKDEESKEMAYVTVQVQLLPGSLPAQTLLYTQWFHADCLANYYQVPVFSEQHWAIMERFIRTAVGQGINMLLTPLFTPPLDTKVGGERLTVQLVEVMREGDTYSFDFALLKRWVDMCTACGIRYFEMSHLFTQWGATCCPKIIATVDGKEEKLFGWHTKAGSEAYKTFLADFLSALTAKLKEWGIADQCWFHISDEPHAEHLGDFMTAKELVLPYIDGFNVIDAYSSVELYDQSILSHPVCAINYIEPFLEHKVPGLWAYYCCGQGVNVSNRFFAMPSARNRIIGLQLYKFGIQGFLHWGYNFYSSQYSIQLLDPYRVTDALFAFPSGDAFSVYPGPDGQPEESLRAVVFLHALQDMRALALLENLTNKAHVLSLIEEGLNRPLTFSEYPRSAEYLLTLRQRVNSEIVANLQLRL